MMRYILSVLQTRFGVSPMQNNQTSNDQVAKKLETMDSKVTNMATKVARLEGRIDPLISMLEAFHGPAHLDSDSKRKQDRRH